jgi:hypothetical protein
VVGGVPGQVRREIAGAINQADDTDDDDAATLPAFLISIYPFLNRKKIVGVVGNSLIPVLRTAGRIAGISLV